MKGPQKIVFESPSQKHYRRILNYLKRQKDVYIIEPFTTYHHKKIKFFPEKLPGSINNLINSGKIKLIKSSSLGSRDTYLVAAEKAVDIVESIYPIFRDENIDLINFVVDSIGNKKAEDGFKKILCEKIASFFSLNSIFHSLEKIFSNFEIEVNTGSDLFEYFEVEKYLNIAGANFEKNKSISFSKYDILSSSISEKFKSISIYSKIFLQGLAGILIPTKDRNKKKRKYYKLGINIISPDRQLRANNRRADFLIDNDLIKKDEVIYFSGTSLSLDEKRKLEDLGSDVCHLPKIGKFFFGGKLWFSLLKISLRNNSFCNAEVVKVAAFMMYSYYKWQRVLQNIHVQHFVTHSDYGIGHIPRNALFREKKTQTWYFMDSINYSANLGQADNKNRHPFWTYLNYDHFVGWNEFIANYFSMHHSDFRKKHIVGCLWSDTIINKKNSNCPYGICSLKKIKDGQILIGAFDTSYTVNGFTSYEEGAKFADDLLRLADENENIFIVLKEKKDRNFFPKVDPIYGPILVELYKRIEKHPRMLANSSEVDKCQSIKNKIKIGSEKISASYLISISDFIISFPFTSTTFEAISSKKNGIWYDPLGLYKETAYGKFTNTMIHTYEDLVKTINFIKNDQKIKLDIRSDKYGMIDSYSDGKSIERFKKLLVEF